MNSSQFNTWLWTECRQIADTIIDTYPSKVTAVDTGHLTQRIQDLILDALETKKL
jgi:hypothetical protein